MARQDGESLEAWRARAQAELEEALAAHDEALTDAIDEVPIAEVDEVPAVEAAEQAVSDAAAEVNEVDAEIDTAVAEATADAVADVVDAVEEAAEQHDAPEDEVAARVREILSTEYGINPTVIAETTTDTVVISDDVEPDTPPTSSHWMDRPVKFRR